MRVEMDEDRLVVYPTPTRMTLILLGSIVFVALGLWLASPAMAGRVDIFGRVVAVIGIVFFGICGVYAAYRLFRRYPLLVVDGSGIIDSASGLAAGSIGWDEIEHIQPYLFHGQRMLGIWPHDLNVLLRRQGWFKRRMMQANIALGCAPVNVPQAVLPMSVDELAALLHERFRGRHR